MVGIAFDQLTINDDYWLKFKLQEADIEYIYNLLLELEIPQTSLEILNPLIENRITREIKEIENQRSDGRIIYLPKDEHHEGQSLVFPKLNWQHGTVTIIRNGVNPELDDFKVIQVKLENEEILEFASKLIDHKLNDPQELSGDADGINIEQVLETHLENLLQALELGLEDHPDFVRIAGRWFPKTLLVDVNTGHLNIAEAMLDMLGGGPLTTEDLLEHVELSDDLNFKLLEFSLDRALEEDPRFDEVGSAGKVVWFLHRLEPEFVKQPPMYIRYKSFDYDRSVLTEAMLALENDLNDELSPRNEIETTTKELNVRLIFPHWRSGTLPLSGAMTKLFPTAYESPRVRFVLIDGENGDQFPGWVVRNHHYVYGLKEWYEKRGIISGSIIKVKKGNKPGEVIVEAPGRRSGRDWLRTILVGVDGGIVIAMLKHPVTVAYDERMGIMIPDVDAVDLIWIKREKRPEPFERVVVNTMRELAKVNPQNHVHASELYAAVNIVQRCPPGPILSLLASRPWFNHVGDLHFRLDDSEQLV